MGPRGGSTSNILPTRVEPPLSSYLSAFLLDTMNNANDAQNAGKTVQNDPSTVKVLMSPVAAAAAAQNGPGESRCTIRRHAKDVVCDTVFVAPQQSPAPAGLLGGNAGGAGVPNPDPHSTCIDPKTNPFCNGPSFPWRVTSGDSWRRFWQIRCRIILISGRNVFGEISGLI
jgi:hypothetical protein